MEKSKNGQAAALVPTTDGTAKDNGSMLSIVTDTINNPESRQYLGVGVGTAILAPLCPPAAFGAVIVFGVYKGWQFFLGGETPAPQDASESKAA